MKKNINFLIDHAIWLMKVQVEPEMILDNLAFLEVFILVNLIIYISWGSDDLRCYGSN
jgi:hypothetical protein